MVCYSRPSPSGWQKEDIYNSRRIGIIGLPSPLKGHHRSSILSAFPFRGYGLAVTPDLLLVTKIIANIQQLFQSENYLIRADRFSIF
jgi:hypothetical protein